MINRIFKLLGLLKSVTRIIVKNSKGLGFNTGKSLTDRLNEIKAKSKKAKSKKKPCSIHHDEQGE